MKKILPILLLICLSACKTQDQRASDDINNLMTADENLVSDDAIYPDGTAVPTDPCGRATLLSGTKYYTINPDGSLSPGVLQGIITKKECQVLIKNNNGARIVRGAM